MPHHTDKTSTMLQFINIKIKRESVPAVAWRLRSLTSTRGSRYTEYPRSRGFSQFWANHPREQRVVIKISYSRNTATRSWAAHGKYLQRHHAQKQDEMGLGFNATDNEIDIAPTLDQWQIAGDKQFFKLIISPEYAHRLDIKAHTIALMKAAERDLGTRLEWIGIDHHNTEHGHVHLLIRGLDQDKKELRIDRDYIATGFRKRSQALLTQQLGLRTAHDISIARSLQIEKDYLTGIDRSLRFKSIEGIVHYKSVLPKHPISRERRLQEIKRLKYLESLDLAIRIDKRTWRISDQLENTLKTLQLSHDILKTYQRHGLYQEKYPEIVTSKELLSKTITGKVIGMGLTDELRDRRYLLVKDKQNKMLFIEANESLIKARDTWAFQNGDTITLSPQSFKTIDGQTIHYSQVRAVHTLEKQKAQKDHKHPSLGEER